MIVDIAVLIVVLVSALIAFIRGFIREILTIAGVVSGLFVAWLAGPKIAPLFRDWCGVDPDADEPQKLFDLIPLEWAANGLAYLCIFLVIVIVISVLSHFLAESTKKLGLGAVDRTLGVIFGIARGVLLVGLFYLPFYLFMDDISETEIMKESKTAFYLDHTAAFLATFLPEDLDEDTEKEEEISETREKLKELNLLKDPNDPTENQEDLEPIDINKDDVIEGYKDNFRDNMDSLFEKKQERIEQEESYNE